MEVISLKLDENMLSNIDRSLKANNYSTRTEFIRDAVRQRLELLRREELTAQFLALSGTAKTKTSDADLRRAREQMVRELCP